MDWNNINTDRDTSGLGPIEYDQSKVPSLSRKYADNVRTKTYGQENRESIARSAEYTALIASEAVNISNETKGRQDNIETRFSSVQQELTDKDVISAPEIIAARNNKATLGQRLDETDEKLEQTETGLSNLEVRSIPFSNSDGAVTRALNTALTYIDRTNIVYGNDYTPFSDLKGTTNGKFEIDCSSFMQTIFTDTDYENSSWHNLDNSITNDNIYGEAYYPLVNHDRKRGRLLAHQMAKYCYDNGLSYVPREDWSNVRVGDLIFFSFNFKEGFWRDIGHVAMVSRIDQSGKITVFEAISGRETGCVESTYEIAQMNGSKRAFLCGRIPLPDTNVKPKLISENNYEGDRGFTTIDELEANKMYTFFMKANLADGVYPILNVGSGSGYNVYSFTSSVRKRPDKMYKVNFYIKNLELLKMVKILLANSTAADTIEFVALYDGYVTSLPPKVESNLKPVRQHAFSKTQSLSANSSEYVSFTNEVESVLDTNNYVYFVDTTVSGTGATTVLASLNQASRQGVTLFNAASADRSITVHLTVTEVLKRN